VGQHPKAVGCAGCGWAPVVQEPGVFDELTLAVGAGRLRFLSFRLSEFDFTFDNVGDRRRGNPLFPDWLCSRVWLTVGGNGKVAASRQVAPADITTGEGVLDEEGIAAIIRFAQGNFRRLFMLLMQNARILDLKPCQLVVTPEVVNAARAGLVIGRA